MNIANVAAFVNQVQGRPVVVFVSFPGCPIIILSHRICDIKIGDGLFQVVKVRFIGKLRVVITDDDQAIVFVFIMPFSQRGNYMPAVNSTEGPHVDGNDFAMQVSQPQRSIHIQPDFIR